MMGWPQVHAGELNSAGWSRVEERRREWVYYVPGSSFDGFDEFTPR